MSLTSLPVELLDAICEPLASNTVALASLARTCAVLRPSAMRVLYRSVSISAYAQNLPMMYTLATRPDLARLVHVFSVTLDDADSVLRAFYTLLHAVLHSMPQLVSLELLVDSDASWVLSGIDFDWTRLEHFACSFPLDAHISTFLTHTPALRSLQISDSASSSSYVLPDTHVPLLESYTGPASLLPCFASRPLTTIYLSGDLKIEDIPQPMGAPTTGESESNLYPYLVPKSSEYGRTSQGIKQTQVQVFSAITSTPPAAVLEALSLAFPALVYLRLMTTSTFWEAPDMTLYTRIATTLASLPALTVFDLSGMHWEARPKSSCAPLAKAGPSRRNGYPLP